MGPPDTRANRDAGQQAPATNEADDDLEDVSRAVSSRSGGILVFFFRRPLYGVLLLGHTAIAIYLIWCSHHYHRYHHHQRKLFLIVTARRVPLWMSR